ncbi:MAG: NTP transferase domain-containing protein [Gemmatimonadales bacterium]|nr:NTP transferase domain-containing protein [Gemmatimonadales bacterium]
MRLDTAIVPCGGLGTRMQPVTRWLPKELLPVGLMPLIHWTLAEAADAGLKRVIVVTNPARPILVDVARDFVGPSALEIVTVEQERPAGLGDALLQARAIVGDDPFAVVLPDNLFRGPNQTAEVLEGWRRFSTATVLIAEIAPEDAYAKGATGRARVREETDGSLRVVDIADKGRGRFDTASLDRAVTPIGRFVFPAEIWDEFDDLARSLAPGAELDDVPVMQRLARRNALVGVACSAQFFDVGVPEGYHQAVTAFPPSVSGRRLDEFSRVESP